MLLNNLEITNVNVFVYWPLLIIVWGLNSLIYGSRNKGSQILSLFAMFLGTNLLLNNLGLSHIDLRLFFRFFWPVLTILIGLSLFLGRSFPGQPNLAILGGVERGNKNTPWLLEAESYLAFMGGVELDLRHALIADGETLLDLTAVMGGIEVKVPADLPIIADEFAILGGVEFFGKGSGGIFGSTRY